MNKKFFGFVLVFVLLFSGLGISVANAIPPLQSVLGLSTEPVTNISEYNADLTATWTWTGISNGDAMPPTSVWFEYGTTPNSFDTNWKKTTMHTENPTDNPEGSYSTDFGFYNLLSDTTYYYRAAAKGNGNPYFGKILSFKTLKVNPVVITGDASGVNEDSAVLNGSWDKSNWSDFFSIDFEYGTSADTTYWTKVDSTKVDKASGSFTFLLKGLDSDTTYYYRATESSGNNDYFGEIKEFTTPESAATLAKVNSTTLSYSTVTDNSVRVKVSGYIAKGEYVFELYSQNTYPGGEYAVPPVMYTNPINANAIEVAFTGLQPNYDYVAVFDKYTPGMIGNTDTAADVQFTTTGLPGSPSGTTTVPSTTTPGTINSGPLPSTKTSGVVPDCGKVVTVMVDGKETSVMNNPCTFKDLVLLLNNVIKFLLFNIATPLIALILMYTGYLYLTAGGKTGQTEKVRHILFNAIIGYVIALAAWLIIKTLLTSFNLDPSIETFL